MLWDWDSEKRWFIAGWCEPQPAVWVTSHFNEKSICGRWSPGVKSAEVEVEKPRNCMFVLSFLSGFSLWVQIFSQLLFLGCKCSVKFCLKVFLVYKESKGFLSLSLPRFWLCQKHVSYSSTLIVRTCFLSPPSSFKNSFHSYCPTSGAKLLLVRTTPSLECGFFFRIAL